MFDDYRMNDHLRDNERRVEQLPVCEWCKQPIQDGYMYQIDGEDVCQDCVDSWLLERKVSIGW